MKRGISICLYEPKGPREPERLRDKFDVVGKTLTMLNGVVLPAHELALVQLSVELAATADPRSVSARDMAGERTRLGSFGRQRGDPSESSP